MKSLLQTLHDNESILLLYLFDELPAEDRAEVEAMLSADANLRSQLNDLSQTYEQVSTTLGEADAANSAGLSHAIASRQANSAISRWSTRRALVPIPPPAPHMTARTWLAYSSGVAAAILAGILIYRGMTSDSPNTTVAISTWPNRMWTQQERTVMELFPSLDAEAASDPLAALLPPADDSERLGKSLDQSEELLNDSLKHVDLNAAEREISTVARLSDPKAIVGGINFE